MSIFDKCMRFTEARDAAAAGFYPYFHAVSATRGVEVRIGGEWKLMAGSNNYLALADHPEVLDAAEAALRRLGSGCTGSRLLNGTLDLHAELEAQLAAFLGKPDAMVFPTGYQANVGAISALVGRRDHVFLDRLDHACLLDGARLGMGTLHRYGHGDIDGLRKLLAAAPDAGGRLVVTDGIFSMDGDIVDLPAVANAARAYGAQLVVDDAHALGVLGATGAGTAEHFGLTDSVDLIMATFSKSLASVGGAVAGPEDVIHYLRHRARTFVFSAALPAASTAGVLKALEILRREPERRERLWQATRKLQEGLRASGFDIGGTCTPIVPVLVGDYRAVATFWRELFYDENVVVNTVVPPGVPTGSARLRVSLTADFTEDDAGRVVEAFVRVRERLAKRSHQDVSSILT